MVRIANIEGQLRASSIRRLGELVDKHPEESLSIVRVVDAAGAPRDGHALDEYRALNGPQKAAVLMLALGEDQCAQLFGMMHEDEIKEVSSAMAQLGPVRSEVVERLCVEFAENLGGTGNLVGSFENTERLLIKSLPRERVSQIMEEIRGPAGRTMWDKLGNVNEAVLANYLKNEYPQTVAVVLSKVRPDHAARVLSMLPDSFAMEVVMRMLRMESVQKDVLDGVERTLRAEFMSNLARTTRRDAHEMMAEIFNNLDRQAETRFLAALEERNREAAERIKSLMFTFDDLQRLTPPAMQTLLRAVEKDKLPLALKGASDKLRDLFFANLSERAGKMLREEIEALGPVRLRDVDEAQAAIVALAKELAAQGRSRSPRTRTRSWCTDAGTTSVRPDGEAADILFAEDFDADADDHRAERADRPSRRCRPFTPKPISRRRASGGLREGHRSAPTANADRAVARDAGGARAAFWARRNTRPRRKPSRAARSIAGLLLGTLAKILPGAVRAPRRRRSRRRWPAPCCLDCSGSRA